MLCSRCKKRPATIFITTNKDSNKPSQGLCFSCASELGIKPLNNLMSQLGITSEDIEKLSAVYFHWKELLIPGQTVSLTDMHDLIYCLHFDVILEMYLIRKYGFLFGSYYPDNEDFLQI